MPWNRSSTNPRVRRTDWFSWTAHLVFGFIGGGLMGFVLGAELLRYRCITPDSLLWLALDGATVVSGIASHLGDRIWINSSIWDCEPPPRSPVSAALSSIVTAAGIVGVVATFWADMNTHSTTADRHANGFLAAAMLPMIGLWVAILLHAIFSGSLILPWTRVERDETPAFFWFLVLLTSIPPLTGALWLVR